MYYYDMGKCTNDNVCLEFANVYKRVRGVCANTRAYYKNRVEKNGMEKKMYIHVNIIIYTRRILRLMGAVSKRHASRSYMCFYTAAAADD